MPVSQLVSQSVSLSVCQIVIDAHNFHRFLLLSSMECDRRLGLEIGFDFDRANCQRAAIRNP